MATEGKCAHKLGLSSLWDLRTPSERRARGTIRAAGRWGEVTAKFPELPEGPKGSSILKMGRFQAESQPQAWPRGPVASCPAPSMHPPHGCLDHSRPSGLHAAPRPLSTAQAGARTPPPRRPPAHTLLSVENAGAHMQATHRPLVPAALTGVVDGFREAGRGHSGPPFAQFPEGKSEPSPRNCRWGSQLSGFEHTSSVITKPGSCHTAGQQ